MTRFDRLPLFDGRGNLRMVVEVASGSHAKQKFDADIDAFVFERHLPWGITYPADWGFFPSTLAADGDPLDALLWDDLVSPPGLVIAVRPIALVRVSQVDARTDLRVQNDRVLVVPADADRMREFTDSTREQLARFFVQAARGSGHEATVEGWGDASAARSAIHDAAHHFERETRLEARVN